MPVRIPEASLAEPAVTQFAIVGGRNHARLIPERNAWAEYRGLTFLFTHGDALQWPLFIEVSRGACRTISGCGDAPEDDLIEGDVGACPCNLFRPLDRIHHSFVKLLGPCNFNHGECVAGAPTRVGHRLQADSRSRERHRATCQLPPQRRCWLS